MYAAAYAAVEIWGSRIKEEKAIWWRSKEQDGGKSSDRRRKKEECVLWSVETSATLSLIVLLSQAAPEFTTSLEHEKHSKLNCEAVAC